MCWPETILRSLSKRKANLNANLNAEADADDALHANMLEINARKLHDQSLP